MFLNKTLIYWVGVKKKGYFVKLAVFTGVKSLSSSTEWQFQCDTLLYYVLYVYAFVGAWD